MLGQPVDEEDVNLLLAQDARDLGEEPLERPHLLGVNFKQPRRAGKEVNSNFTLF